MVDTGARLKGIIMEKESDDNDYTPKIGRQLKQHLVNEGIEAEEPEEVEKQEESNDKE